jgi:hypothetical protein
METLPESAPAAVGLNAIVKFILEPAATVAGAVSPDMLKPAPEMVVLEIARSAVPVFDTFIVWVDSVLTVTLPKLAEEGVTLIAGVPEPGLPPPVPLLPVTPQPTRPGPEISKTARKAKSRIDAGEATLALSSTRTQHPPELELVANVSIVDGGLPRNHWTQVHTWDREVTLSQRED